MASVEKVPMLEEGFRKLEAELQRLKEERPLIVDAIEEARAHGDLKENAEYHAAREQQSFCEGRIQEIEGKLADCEVIDVTKLNNTGKVVFGTTVTLIDPKTERRVVYQIVGEDEADVKLGKISYTSPVARAMMGKEEADNIVVKAPSGDIAYEIDKVEYL